MTTSILTGLLSSVSLNDTAPFNLIDSVASLSDMLDAFHELPTEPPSLYIDLEGERLSRDGSVSILQIHVLPTRLTYLVDIHSLGHEGFSTRGLSGRNLKDILESEDIPKVFFDVRNDSDALYSHFCINLAGVQDLQLMELATRTFSKKHVNGLARCIERDANLSVREREEWKECKENGVRLFAPEHGGRYQVFNERPLADQIMHYCVQDVQFLPRLWDCYNSKLTLEWWRKVRVASAERITESQSPSYLPHGKQKALAPPDFSQSRRGNPVSNRGRRTIR